MNEHHVLTAFDTALRERGWSRFRFDTTLSASWTRPLADDVIVVASVFVSEGRGFGGSWLHDDGPVALSAWLGVGYLPAVRLAPRLTLTPQADLIHVPWDEDDEDDEDEDNGDDDPFVGPDDVDGRVSELLEAIDVAWGRLCTRPPGLAEIESLARDEAHALDDPDSDLPLFLASTGRAQEALDLALAQQDKDPQDEEFARFVRQLRLWLAAGTPPPPPLDSWPVDMFRPVPDQDEESTRERHGRARREAKLRNEARDAVRGLARRLSTEELADRLEREHSDRGLTVSRGEALRDARLLRLGPAGRLKVGWQALTVVGDLARDAFTTLRAAFDDPSSLSPGPRWTRPPEDAQFVVPGVRGSELSVVLGPGADAVVERLMAERTGRSQVFGLPVWLDRSACGPSVDVMVGEHHVGHLTDTDAALFTPAFEAAARFQERPRSTAMLQWLDEPIGHLLTVPKPAFIPPIPDF